MELISIYKELEKLLDSKNLNTDETWDSIKINGGSVQHLGFLTKDEKDIFKTLNYKSPLAEKL